MSRNSPDINNVLVSLNIAYNVFVGINPTLRSYMGQLEKLLEQILQGRSDANISFAELCKLLLKLGFKERIKGSHHIFSKHGIEEILNLQPIGANAKPYQVKQVRNVIVKYKLGGERLD